MMIKKTDMSTKELTQLYYELLEYNKNKHNSEQINPYDHTYKKEYKWEDDNNLITGDNSRPKKLVCYESGYNDYGNFIQLRRDCLNVPSNDVHLVPQKPGVKSEKK